jgi:hypothetical protein
MWGLFNSKDELIVDFEDQAEADLACKKYNSGF